MLNLEIRKAWFKDHIATFTDLGNIKIIDFKKPGDCCCYIRFLFDEDSYCLHITGDLGELTATNYKNMTYECFGDFVHNPSYFLSKVNCHSRQVWEYNDRKAYNDLKEQFQEYELECPEDYDSIDECIQDILDNFSDERGISEHGYHILSDIDSDCWEWCGDLGKESTGIVELYLLAFELATEQLKNKEKSNV